VLVLYKHGSILKKHFFIFCKYRKNTDFGKELLLLSLSGTYKKQNKYVGSELRWDKKGNRVGGIETHNLHPELIKTDEGFGIKACCEPFREKMVEKSGKMIEEETQKILEKMLKNMFKE
jgi:hypothetical protein